MTDQPKRGKRVQIYLPADLLERWNNTPRYERSATVAKALRQYWKTDTSRNSGFERGTKDENAQQDA